MFDGLKKHRTFELPRAMRTFLFLILMCGEPTDLKLLWEEFKEDLAEDFIRAANRNSTSIDDAAKKAYRIIANMLDNETPEGRRFDY
uniref:Uncharacterized protein n=1 Tax=Acrobeloides nanus TaxID=290746 RepID=A0A914CUL0_9BILA